MPKQLDDVEELISCLEFRSNLGDPDANDPTLVDVHPADGDLVGTTTYDIDLLFEQVAAEALKRYLRGRGHPDHHILREMLGAATLERDHEDTLLRARLFLRSMTGDDLIHSENLKIQVFFSHRGHRVLSEPTQWRSLLVPVPIEVHACFAHCTITVDEALRNLLNEGPPFSQFEAWLHGMFLDPTEYLNM
ncbi:hypothetical protein OH76DRAFT_1490774 [Lentinus brumalis]|uniref:Uncharacterized protein n=1 Tax=Lentinus brumalis TaxID=2498619 RepID=A0A371CHX8_9APHY|nr:hypothetical protein OH76DRAFT_1490774 [Polyporus brumalis]